MTESSDMALEQAVPASPQSVDPVPRSVFRWRDLANETVVALTARPGRTLLTALGSMIGVAALVTTLGLAKTAGNQIVARFDELAASDVTISLASEPDEPSSEAKNNGAIPWDAGSRLRRLNGVKAAGTYSELNVEGRAARSVPVVDPQSTRTQGLSVVAASHGLFPAVRAEIDVGRWFDSGHDQRADPVAVLGPAAAKRLNITRIDNSPAIFLGDEVLVVIGILAGVERQPNLLGSIIVPDGYAADRLGLTGPATVQVDAEIGAAKLIGSQAPLAFAPSQPSALQVAVPPEPEKVRSNVQSDLNALFLLLGAVSLVVGGIGIANVTLVSVLERTSEIGLRRALGATRRHVAIQFVTESTTLGAFAGIVGAVGGLLAVIGVSYARRWTPVLDLWLPLAAPALGAAVGLVAGTYPAWRASAIEPIAALHGRT